MCRKKNKFVWRYLNIYRIRSSSKMKLVKKASKLEVEIENWCQLSGFDPYSKEYKEIKGRLVDAVAPLNADKIKEIANRIEY